MNYDLKIKKREERFGLQGLIFSHRESVLPSSAPLITAGGRFSNL